MCEMLHKVNEGKASEKDLENILRLAKVMRKASLCGLGQAAPIPVESTIKHFKYEYMRKLV